MTGELQINVGCQNKLHTKSSLQWIHMHSNIFYSSFCLSSFIFGVGGGGTQWGFLTALKKSPAHTPLHKKEEPQWKKVKLIMSLLN